MNPQRPPRVLVVDDEVLITMLVADMLDELGCETVGPAHDLSEALDLARAEDIDWAILDLMLGGTHSYPVADVLSKRQVPFAFATGYGSADLKPEFGGATVLQKPFRVAEIAAALETIRTAGMVR